MKAGKQENSKLTKLIYILGNSRTGSTILSYFISKLQDVHYTGEIKKFSNIIANRICSCGDAPIECKFWGNFIKNHEEIFMRQPNPESGFIQFLNTLKAIFFGITKKLKNKEEKFMDDLNEHFKSYYGSDIWLLDSSKSLNRLILLDSIPSVELKIIYLEKDLKSILNSFVNRGKSLIFSYLRLKSNNMLIRHYLRKKNSNVLKIQFENFREQPSQILEEIAEFIGTPNSSQNFNRVEQIHLISGNQKIRKAVKEGNIKLRKKEDFSYSFNNSQKALLRFLNL